jgi:S1-C subfamily serine protease
MPIDNKFEHSNKNQKNMRVDLQKNLLFLLTLFSSNLLFGQDNSTKIGSGSGFALESNGYIATNNHVVFIGSIPFEVNGKTYEMPYNKEGDFFQITRTINGESVNYLAKFVKADKGSDLAILKIIDTKFKGFGTLPYAIPTQTVLQGSDIFAMGYPRTDIQGNAIKVTKGIIIATEGEGGDASHYSISASIDHGSSGGPLFNDEGNIIGVTDAGISIEDSKKAGKDAISTSQYYAIKILKLKLLLDLLPEVQMPTQNLISTKSFTDKVKILKENVFIVTTFLSESSVKKIKSDIEEYKKSIGTNNPNLVENQAGISYINPSKMTFHKGFMSRDFMIGNNNISNLEAENYISSNPEAIELMKQGTKSYRTGTLMFFAGPAITLTAILVVAGKPQSSVADAVGLIGIGGFISSFFFLSSANKNYTNAVYKYNLGKGLANNSMKSKLEIGYLGTDRLGLRLSF